MEYRAEAEILKHTSQIQRISTFRLMCMKKVNKLVLRME